MSEQISPNLTKGTCHKCGERCFRICYVGHRLVCVNCFEQHVFACNPCECGGMCDKCRQNEREGGEQLCSSGLIAANWAREGNDPAKRAPAVPRSLCLCDPDTDAVCDRTCP